MTHICCAPCRLRLDRASASGSDSCPRCGGPLVGMTAEEALGLALPEPEDRHPVSSLAVAVALAARPDREDGAR